MIRSIALALTLLAMPAAADVTDTVDTVLDDHVLPRIGALADTTAALSDTAAETCDVAALRPLWSDAFRAWSAASHLRLGPTEAQAQAVAFWPDDRDFAGRGLRLLMSGDMTPETVARASVAARGLMALERLLWDMDAGEATCEATRAVAADLARTTATMRAGWTGADGFAATMRGAGKPGNTRFLSPGEAEAALYTALVTGLEFTADQRLARPLGTFERPRATRAEAYRSGQSLPAIVAALRSLRDLATTLRPAPRTDAAFQDVLDLAGRVRDPSLAGVDDPSDRLRIEALQSAVRAVLRVASEEIGPTLERPVGFNALDGD